MTATIRRARPSDRKQFAWKPYYDGVHGPFKPWVVTVEGVVYLVFENRKVVYQNGSEAVPNLTRMALRYFDTLQLLYEDRDQRKREAVDQRLRDSMTRLRNMAS